MFISIGLNPKTTVLIGIICGLGYVLYKKEMEIEALNEHVTGEN